MILRIFLVIIFYLTVFAEGRKNVVELCGMDMMKEGLREEKALNETQRAELEEKQMADDTILTPEQSAANSKGKKAKRAVQRGNTVYWPTDKPIYYSLSKSVEGELKTKIEESLELLKKYTCIEFEEVDEDNPDKYHINFVQVSAFKGARSNIGMTKGTVGKSKYKQDISVPKILSHHKIVHEIMHSFGFVHEHQRPDRDKYVTINWENMSKDQRVIKNFELEKDVNYFGEEYDFNSIMHYGQDFMGLTDKKTDKDGKVTYVKRNTISAKKEYGGAEREVGSKGSLTDSDIRRLNKLFMCEEPNEVQKEEALEKIEKQDPKDLLDNSKEVDVPDGLCDKYRKLHQD